MDADADYPVTEDSDVADHENSPTGSGRRQASRLSVSLRPPRENSDGEFEADEDDYGSGGDDYYISRNSQNLPFKRPAEDSQPRQLFKRQRGLLNSDYLNILNQDIQDAAQRVTLGGTEGIDKSQIGLTHWSAVEKTIFFESLARLGRTDVRGIAARIGSKSEVEVNHYLQMLYDKRERWIPSHSRQLVGLTEYPAAVELSQQCCRALDEAADAISVRQENQEQRREEGKWGDTWDLTPDVAKKIEDEKEEPSEETQQLASVKMFHLSTWLKLSQRLFMNSSVPGDNWLDLDDTPPSIWATTFEDFHSLVVSITRRLVQTTIFTALSRIKSRREGGSNAGDIIRRRDVEVAIESLGMPTNTNAFWRDSARRLRLEVYELDQYGEEITLTYDQVEDALATTGLDRKRKPTATDLDEPEEEELYKLDDDDDDDDGDDGTAPTEPTDKAPYERARKAALPGNLEATVGADAMEVFGYSLADFPDTVKLRRGLDIRIATELEQEDVAEQADQYASYKEELAMWEMLQRQPPAEIPKRKDPGPASRSSLNVEGLYPIGRDWLKSIEYKGEWEDGR